MFIIVFLQFCESYDQLCEFEKNPGPTQYNTDHHELQSFP